MKNQIPFQKNDHYLINLTIVVWLLVFPSLACRVAENGFGIFPETKEIGGDPLGALDEDILSRLTLSISPGGQAKPGETIEIRVGTNECCYVFQPVEADVRWLVEPANGAAIDPETGVLTIAQDVKSGVRFTVTADVENGRKQINAPLTIYRLEDNPLIGTWHELEAIPCASASMPETEDPIRELVFKADGSFLATFTPFEVYHDYWGIYQIDLVNHTLSMTVTDGNVIPASLDLDGFFEIDEEGVLVLKEMWLGRREATDAQGCGHRFRR